MDKAYSLKWSPIVFQFLDHGKHPTQSAYNLAKLDASLIQVPKTEYTGHA